VKGKKQAGKLGESVYIRPLIKEIHDEKLREESDRRKISMNMMYRRGNLLFLCWDPVDPE